MPVPSDYNPNIPQPTDQLAASQPSLLNNFGAIQAMLDVNHVDFAAAGAGKHYFIEFPAQSGDQVTAAAEVGMYSKTSTLSGAPELYIRKQSNGTVIEFTSAAAASPGWTRLPSNILLKWGVGTAVGAGALVVTLPVAVNIPVFANVFNAQITPSSNITTYVTGLTTTTVTVNCSGAGTFYYYVIGN